VKPGYIVTHTKHGTVVLVTPAVFTAVAKTNKYHLYATESQRLVNVPVIYAENETLFAHELWPFKLADLPPELSHITQVLALCAQDLNTVITGGYTSFAAAKIRGEV
jgi:hypothetical protein